LYLYDEKVSDEYYDMPVTTENNINTLFGFSWTDRAFRVTIEEIERRVN
jgi:hypothetical protein